MSKNLKGKALAAFLSHSFSPPSHENVEGKALAAFLSHSFSPPSHENVQISILSIFVKAANFRKRLSANANQLSQFVTRDNIFNLQRLKFLSVLLDAA
jgi:hypothetical protein